MKKECNNVHRRYKRWLCATKVSMMALMLVMVVGAIVAFTLSINIHLGKVDAEVLQMFAKIWIAIELLVVIVGSISIDACEGYKKKCDNA